jgi:hypothetical protein
MLGTLFLGDDETTNETDPLAQPNVDDKRLGDTIKLDSLGKLLAVKGKASSSPLDESASEHWVLPINAKLVAALAKLDAKKRPGIAKKWADTEEWQRDGGTATTVDKLLGQMVKLAKQAVDDERPMYLWISL